MAEILTESFCERCGSRYTFESEVPRARLRGVKVLSRGLKNFVLDDKTSIDEAMAAARDDTDRALTSQQLDAFHKTFNFCMQCRQYICPDCWNDAAGYCLTCAPMLGHGILPAPFPNLDPSAGLASPDENGLAAAAMNGHKHTSEEPNGFDPLARLDGLTVTRTPTPPAAPTSEMIGTSIEEGRPEASEAAAAAETADVEATSTLEPATPVAEETPAPDAILLQAEPIEAEPATLVDEEPVARAEAAAGASLEAPSVEVELIAEPELMAEPAAHAEPAAAVSVEDVPAAPEAEAKPEAAAASDAEELRERLAAAAAQTSLLLAGLRPGVSLDDAIAAFESQPDVAAKTDVAAADATDAEPVEAATDLVGTIEPAAPTWVADEEPLSEVVAEAAQPEPEPYLAPLDEIPTGESVAAGSTDESPAMSEDHWLVERDLIDVALSPSPVVEPVVVEPVAVEPPVVEVAAEPVSPAAPEPAEIAAVAPPIDVVDQPTWTVVAPSPATVDGVRGPVADPTVEPPAAPVAPPTDNGSAPAPEPNWPSQPQWPAPLPSTGLPFLGRPAVPTGGVDALWAESDRAVSAPGAGAEKPVGGVQPCVSCGLSLSASARFCRRCGTNQVG
jgi:hypothetical protein